MKERLAALGRRFPPLGRALAVHERVGEVDGGFVAAGITLSVFVSIFPLLLVAIAVIGFLASGDEQLPTRLIDQLGLTGAAADTMRDAVERSSATRQAASLVGFVGLAWSGSAVAGALQHGVRAPWFARPEGLRDRLVGAGWLVVAAVGFAVALALGGVLNVLPDEVPKVLVTVAAVAVGLAIEIGLFWWMLWGLGTRSVPARELLPGAVVGGIGFEALKLVGTVYVPHLVSRSSTLYGPIGIVFAILAWLALFARLLIYASAVNAVRAGPSGSAEPPLPSTSA
jgi:membrane protein